MGEKKIVTKYQGNKLQTKISTLCQLQLNRNITKVGWLLVLRPIVSLSGADYVGARGPKPPQK